MVGVARDRGIATRLLDQFQSAISRLIQLIFQRFDYL
jgi:hypothetical protein